MLLVDGSREDVADCLTRLVDIPDVVVSPDDRWMPYGKPVYKDGSWYDTLAREARFHEPNCLVSPEVRLQLLTWWLAVTRRANTPNWDIASTCRIEGKPGLILVEAKAYREELAERDESGSVGLNRERIGQAIAEANNALQAATGNTWALSRDCHYQLSNRFAWSWKLASLGVPVVLIYFGFLNAHDMADRGTLFQSEADWECAVKDYSRGIVDETCWGERLDVAGVLLIPLIRAVEQPFDPDECCEGEPPSFTTR